MRPNEKPTQTEVNAMMAEYTAQRFNAAAQLARKLAQRYPQHWIGWKMLGVALQQLGNNAGALSPMKKAISLVPHDDEAHKNLGLIFQELGRMNEAESSFRQALRINPKDKQVLRSLGTVLHALNRPHESASSLRQALLIDPAYALAHLNLGDALNALGQLDEAEFSYRQALQLDPRNENAYCNLGHNLKALGRMDEAEACFRRALQIREDFAAAHYNLGATLQELNRLEEAEACYRRALQLNPHYAEAHNNLGNIHRGLGRLNDAEACYRRALQNNVNFSEAHCNLGVTIADLGRIDEAYACYRRALAINPSLTTARNNLLFIENYDPDKTGAEIYSVYKEIGSLFDVRVSPTYSNNRDTQRRLKIGYVSPDFKMHSARHFIEPLLAHHDKRAVEVIAYAELLREDVMTMRFKRYVDQWVPTRNLSDEALTQRIHADQIDILVDLAGHTDGNRLGVFGNKPAPVSVTWLGCNYTTGLASIDYLLTDEISAPAGSEHLFSERPWRLTSPHYVYLPAEGMGEVNTLPAAGAGFVTFGSLTRGIRINHRVIRVWSEILKRVTEARLVIDSKDFRTDFTQNLLSEKFIAHGVRRDQLLIGYRSPPWDALRSLDIGLDCFPHNSGTTLYETLYMGVPFITLAERPSLGRLGSSILKGIGHPEWIADTEEQYIEKAVALAGNLPALAGLRVKLRQEMQNSPLMDGPGFARKVEAAYRDMFARWAAG